MYAGLMDKHMEKKNATSCKTIMKESRVKSHVGRAKSPFGRVKPPVQERAFVKLFIRTAKSWNMPVVRQSRLLSQKKRTFARTGTTNELGREEIDIHVYVCLRGFCSHVSKVLRRV